MKRIALRNKIENTINETWKDRFGATAHCLPAPIGGSLRITSAERSFLWRFVLGTAKDGRSICIYPIGSRSEVPPVAVCQYMLEIEKRGGLVGTAEDIGDVFAVLADNPEYKRASKTYNHRKRNQEGAIEYGKKTRKQE